MLHIDSTTTKASASKDSVIVSGAELVSALRQAYQEQEAKLEILPAEAQSSAAASGPPPSIPSQSAQNTQIDGGASSQSPADTRAQAKPLAVNSTHVSTTDPQAQLARNKSGVTELSYKHHRVVDDAHGIITAVSDTDSNVPDGSQLPSLYEQHLSNTGSKQAQVTIAGDHHYGTASNYLFCAQQGIRAHLAEASAHLEQRGKLPLSQFVYEPAADRLRCPQGHYLVLHQERRRNRPKYI